MRQFSFTGGIHPDSSKKQTQWSPIVAAPLPQTAILPLLQHTGVMCTPLVKKGDRVLTGQKIADSDAFISVPIHASISGTVKDIKLFIDPFGRKIPTVFIESDGKDEWDPAIKPSGQEPSTQEIPKRVRETGIVGMGGAAFPTHVKLTPPKDKHVDTLIINAVECEPYLTSDHRLMVEHSREIVKGILYLQRALNVDRVLIGIEDNKPEAISNMLAATEANETMQVAILRTKYPQGSEKQLIDALLHRQVPLGKLPADVGVVVQNVGSAFAVCEAMEMNKPLIERIITVSGPNVVKPVNLRARIGTSLNALIALAGGTREPVGKIIMGGPMMGIAVPSDDVPVVKGTSGVLVFRQKDVNPYTANPCIRCGQCRTVCPMGLTPEKYVDPAQHKKITPELEKQIMNCMECGSCSYICPARRPLVHWIKVAKVEIRKQKTKTSN